jgi:acetyl-CoA acetyltransferase family protein
MSSAYVYATTRTPFGKFNGALAGIRPDDLSAHTIKAVLELVPKLDHTAIDDTVWGAANQSGEDNRNAGRMGVLLAGLPVSVSATTVNRLCGSSLDAAIMASRQIETGDADIVLTGGAESMTRAPWVLPKPARGFPAADVTAVSTTLGWRFVNPAMPAEWTANNGEANEQLADKFGIGRDRQDEFGVRSHLRAAAAWDAGFYDDIVTSVPRHNSTPVTRDEGVRADSTLAAMAALNPSFRKTGTITAGNASPLSDGASALLLGSQQAAATIGADPIARIAGRGVFALEPHMFGYAPVEAANRAVARAGITWDQVGAVELNEAFAVQSLVCIDAWTKLGLRDRELVNQKGGAIAIGHPLGASGGRILGTLTKVLRESGERWGVAAICIGVGQGLAVVLENVSVR